MRLRYTYTSRFTARRTLFALALAAGLFALAPQHAVHAQTGSFTHTTAADFGAACATRTNTQVSDANGGEVRLAATLEDYFSGSAVDTSRWLTGSVYNWYVVPPSVSGGELTLDSAYVRSRINFNATRPRFFETRALIRTNNNPAGWPDLGFYRDQPPLSYNNTYPTTSAVRIFVATDANLLQAWGRDGNQNQTLYQNDIAGVTLTQSHTYRMEWEATITRFYVDGVQRTTIPGVNTLDVWAMLYHQTPSTIYNVAPMRVDWVRAGAYAASGAYDSCTLDAGQVVAWTTQTLTALTPTGTSIGVSTRTSTNGVNWSAWQAVSGNAVVSPNGRYLQYRLSASTTNSLQTPEVQQVTMNYAPAGSPTNTPTNTSAPPTNTATATRTPTQTNTAVPPTATRTPTPTNTPVPPTATRTSTPTNTAVAPTVTFTNTPVPPTATRTPTSTNTAIAPTATFTNTPVPPTATRTSTSTNTAIAPTATFTNTPVPPTATNTPLPPTPTNTPSSANYALQFDGANDLVTAGQVVGTGPLTIEAWVQPATANATGILIVGGDDNTGWSLELSNGALVFWVSTNQGWQFVQHPTALAQNQWTHIAATYNANVIQVFVNGTPATAVNVGALTQGPWLRLGGLPGYSYFSGAMDDVRLSNNVRYSGAFTPLPTLNVDGNTLRLWRFTEGIGQTALDAATGALATLGQTADAASDDPLWVTR